MSLSEGFDPAFPPRSIDIVAEELELAAQLIDKLVMLSDSLIANLRGFIQRGLQVLDLLIELVQQVMAFAGISGPRAGVIHEKNYFMITK